MRTMLRVSLALCFVSLVGAACSNGARRGGSPGNRGGGGGGGGGGANPDASLISGDDAAGNADATNQTPADAGVGLDFGFVDFGFPPMADTGTGFLDARVVGDTVRSIAALQDPNHPDAPSTTCRNDGQGAVGTCAQADLTNVVVTAVDGFVSTNLRALWIQDPNDADGRHAGIKVIYPVNSLPFTVTVGMFLNVQAEAIRFRGAAQLQFATLTQAPLPPMIINPTVVTPSQISRRNPASQAYEGSLIAVRNVAVQVACIADSRDRDHGQWIINDDAMIGNAFMYAYNGDLRPPEIECFDAANNPTGNCGCSAPLGSPRPNDMRQVGDQFLSITGVLDFAFDDFQLQPRNDLDLVQ